MKNIITETEKERILELHDKFRKNLINEQNLDIRTELQKIVDGGCIPRGTLVSTTFTDPNLKFAIKQESQKTPGTFRYFFFNDKMGAKDAQGNIVVNNVTWKSKIEACLASKKQQQVDKDVKLTQEEGGFMKREDIKDTQNNIDNPEMYEKRITKDGVVLYRKKFTGGVTGAGLTPDQQAVIKKWKDNGALLKSELDPEQIKSWYSVIVSPKSEGIFSEDLIMYLDPASQNQAVIDVAFTKASQSQDMDKKSCKAKIDTFYNAFKKGKTFEPNVMQTMKYNVQKCAKQHEFKGLFDKTDKYLDVLTGRIQGGPSEDSPFRLK
jgi:hypothetical protein